MKGFTLIESLIAISILTFAVAGPLFTADRAIVAAQTSRDQVIAMYLAQEGIEHMRMLRDNEYISAYHAGDTNISDTAWTTFLTTIAVCDATDPTKACTLDSMNGLLGTSCVIGTNCAPLRLVGGTYRQITSLAPFTPFTRVIQAFGVSTGEEKIVSTVSWNFHGVPYSVKVSDQLTAWQ